jgi:alpha-N-arabinofuranosidase
MQKIPLDMMWGISLHYYTIPRTWANKGSATAFDEKEYFNTMRQCLRMEELVSRHSTIMDRYDPLKKVALVVDEWGIWTNVEPGTNPGFLFQQNSLRDALIAGTTLNIFNNHSDRVKMANLAQTINVLQALILTRGNAMLLTPTYHVFDLYKAHMDAKLLPVQFKSPDYNSGNDKIPAMNISASQDSAGTITITVVNLDPHKKQQVNTILQGIQWKSVKGRILTSSKLTDVNTFESPAGVKPVPFTGAKKSGSELVAEIPAQSIVSLELRN